MPFKKKKTAVCCDNHTEYTNTSCGENRQDIKRYSTWYKYWRLGFQTVKNWCTRNYPLLQGGLPPIFRN